MDVPGSVLANDPIPGMEMDLCRPRGLGKLFLKKPIGVKVYQKMLHADNCGPGPGGGRGEERDSD